MRPFDVCFHQNPGVSPNTFPLQVILISLLFIGVCMCVCVRERERSCTLKVV